MEVGQIVRIKQDAEVMEYHEHLLGEEGRIVRIYPDGDIQVVIDDGATIALLALHPDEVEIA